MPSDDLFAPIFVPERAREAVSGKAWLQAMLDAERALAAAESRAGVIPAEAAEAIAACCRVERFDVEAIGREGRVVANPAEPLVRALRAQAGDWAHHGATSQDILDSAAMLIARNVRELVAADLEAVARSCARLADEHRGTVMAGRTLLQQAVPTTFGLKAAGWLIAVLDARGRLLGLSLPAQLGGAAGTLAALGDSGAEVLGLYAEELGLAEPLIPWHALRTPVFELGAALDLVAGTLAKVARDLALLAQSEVAEVRVPSGGSSTMPHKRNPVGPVLVDACARQVHAAVSALSLEHEHERAAGAWQAEWRPLSEALALTAGAAAAARETLEGLEVDTERMRANLSPETLSEAERFFPDRELRPEDYLGATDAFVERALARFREELE